MNKQIRACFISLVHFIWAVSLCFGAYYIEYGIMSIFMRWGVIPVIAANIAVGIILFIGFYALERKLLAQEVSKTALFVLATYVLPFAFQWMMLIKINDMYSASDSEGMAMTIIFTFSCLLMGISLFARAIMALYTYAKNKLNENKPLF